MEPVEIKSSRGRRSLIFSNVNGDYFDTKLTGDAISATKTVWGYTDTALLVDLFESMARDWKGWDGKRHWAAIEGDLEITATSDRLGHVMLDIMLQNNDPEDNWRVEAPIYIDAGSLEEIEKKVRKFFG